MTLSTTLKQTEDVALNAISSQFFQEGASAFPIVSLYQNEDPFNGRQTIQTFSLVGDDFDYVVTYDVTFNLTWTISSTNRLELAVIHLVINADNATVIAAQDESDYNNVGDNGTFVGGTGHAALDVITLNDETTVRVDAVSGGAVTQFTVLTAGTGEDWVDYTTRQQSSTTGSGVLFALAPQTNNTVDWDNIKISTGLTIFAARVQSYAFSVDSQGTRTFWQTTVDLPTGSQYNFGTVIYKYRDSGSDTLTGTVNKTRQLSYVRYKR